MISDALSPRRRRSDRVPPVGQPRDASRRAVSFGRTPLGDARVRAGPGGMPLHLSRLLLLFEEPQAVGELRKMLDASWLPHALLELEQRGLLYRVPSQTGEATAEGLEGPPSTAANIDAAARDPGTTAPPAEPDEPGFATRRARVRAAFHRPLGAIGDAMATRIGLCRSGAELGQLMPQVAALLLALAGPRALASFEAEIVARADER